MVTPLTQKLLNWGDFENSLLYLFSAVEVNGYLTLAGLLSIFNTYI